MQVRGELKGVRFCDASRVQDVHVNPQTTGASSGQHIVETGFLRFRQPDVTFGTAGFDAYPWSRMGIGEPIPIRAVNFFHANKPNN